MTTNGDYPPQAQVNGVGDGPQIVSTTPGTEVICGPLLNYRRMSNEHSPNPQWHGSVLIVTTPGQQPAPLRLRFAGLTGINGGQSNSEVGDRTFNAIKLCEDPRKAFFNYEIDLPFQEQEAMWTYHIADMKPAGGLHKQNPDKPCRFYVPSKHESFRIMFHSCNGFSVGTDMETWKGPSLWNDVLRMQAEQPFHVMIGGGDQIYNDSVRTDGPLKPWTAISNPRKRREFPFDEDMRSRCDQYYFDNYVDWYGTEPFAAANAQIPQLNIWDDHDIIDGFGSYTDHFMQCAVFRGIGGVAHKYYMLFQHHIPPPASTFTTAVSKKHHFSTKASPGTPMSKEGQPLDPMQLERTFVMKPSYEDPSYIIGPRPGPYVEERSRSMYCQLGKRIAFAGIDARTERTRHQINYPETYELFFSTLASNIEASKGEIKHLILLLGVPIAYPRLQWLENILQSPLVGPIRFLNKRFGVAGGLFNQFDGGVDLLDDLDDHYTAHQHKKERKDLIHRIQNLAKEYSVRVTILGGDVHLSAFGRFYSKPELNIPAEKDYRYIANIVSSAITNKPPPQAVANLLARRNKIHHFDHETDETLLELFDKQPGAGEPGVKPKSAANNKATMPSRNYAIIAESHPHRGSTGQADGALANGANGINGSAEAQADNTDFVLPKNPREPIHKGEQHAGASHPAASGLTRTGLAGLDGLDVTIRVEKNPEDREGRTEGYGLSVPALDCRGYKEQGRGW
ncbi:hypothetical protein LTR09_002738 [Extremus antarcticus]|uniref:PhoD-like phosphatase domain-containing protein n=1 Tax=Extremus antarcticus TaxID=702011 RepID=A0AAJ0GEY5_9PEZI|nr:hypothetical protein LTR09_002738 [Extremus antarcticus]